jgi:hypothetical protein
MLHRAVCQVLTDISEGLTAFIISRQPTSCSWSWGPLIWTPLHVDIQEYTYLLLNHNSVVRNDRENTNELEISRLCAVTYSQSEARETHRRAVVRSKFVFNVTACAVLKLKVLWTCLDLRRMVRWENLGHCVRRNLVIYTGYILLLRQWNKGGYDWLNMQLGW